MAAQRVQEKLADMKNREIPEDMKKEIATWNCSSASEVCFVTRIEGNIPVVFFSSIVAQLYRKLDPEDSTQSVIVWKNGMRAMAGDVGVLAIYDGESRIDLSVRGPPAELPVMWDILRDTVQIVDKVRDIWWPGMISSHCLLCTHCLIKQQITSQVDVHQLDLEEQIQNSGSYHTACCRLTDENFPAGLIVPVTDANAEKRIIDVKRYLEKNFEENTQPACVERSLKQQTSQGEDLASNFYTDPSQTSFTSSESYEEPSCYMQNETGKLQRLNIRGSQSDYRLCFKPGVYSLKNSHITVSIPHGTGVSGLSEVLISVNSSSEFQCLEHEKRCSDVITLQPHGLFFDKHLLLKIPLDKNICDDSTPLHLLYSHGDEKEGNSWINIKQHGTHALHQDDMFWFMYESYAYVFTRHFCKIVFVNSQTSEEQHGMSLNVAVSGSFSEGLLKIIFGFYCGECNPDLLHQQRADRILLECTPFIVYENEGPVTVEFSPLGKNSNWEKFGNLQHITVNRLIPLCQVKQMNEFYSYCEEIMSTEEDHITIRGTATIKQNNQEKQIVLNKTIAKILPVLKETGVMTESVEISSNSLQNDDSYSLGKHKNHSPGASFTENFISLDDQTVEDGNSSLTLPKIYFTNEHVSTLLTGASKNEKQWDKCSENESETESKKSLANESVKQGKSDGHYSPNKHNNYSGVSYTTNDISLHDQTVKEGNKLKKNESEKQDNKCSDCGLISNSTLPVGDNKELKANNFKESLGKQMQRMDDTINNNQVLTVNNNVFQYNVHMHISENFNQLALQEPDFECIFNRSVAHEEQELYRLIDEADKDTLTTIAKLVGDQNRAIDTKNLSASTLLQVWNLHVKEGVCTWRELYITLQQLDCDSAAKQLELTHDKHNLISNMQTLNSKIHLESTILAYFLQNNVMSDRKIEDMEKDKRSEERLIYIIREIIVRNPHNYKQLKGFFNSLCCIEWYVDLLKRYVLLPDQLRYLGD